MHVTTADDGTVRCCQMGGHSADVAAVHPLRLALGGSQGSSGYIYITSVSQSDVAGQLSINSMSPHWPCTVCDSTAWQNVGPPTHRDLCRVRDITAFDLYSVVYYSSQQFMSLCHACLTRYSLPSKINSST